MEITIDYIRIFSLILLIGLTTWTDVKSMKILNKHTITAVAIGLVVNVFLYGKHGLQVSLSGMSVGFLIVLLVYLIGGVRAGDVKLFAGIGSIMGVLFVVNTIIYSLMCGALIGMIILLYRGELKKRMAKLANAFFFLVVLKDVGPIKEYSHSSGLSIPFMYAVVPSSILSAFIPIQIWK